MSIFPKSTELWTLQGRPQVWARHLRIRHRQGWCVGASLEKGPNLHNLGPPSCCTLCTMLVGHRMQQAIFSCHQLLIINYTVNVVTDLEIVDKSWKWHVRRRVEHIVSCKIVACSVLEVEPNNGFASRVGLADFERESSCVVGWKYYVNKYYLEMSS